ncbi:MAG: substrate-binding domain-containing protein, partial [Planctomycetaceae bacterium]
HNLGVVADDRTQLQELLTTALECDLVLLSGGTSKGAGDISYAVVAEHTNPGVIVHGVALKPGKPLCLAAHQRKPVVVLPGFPTSAIFTFHEFVAPVIRALLGKPDRQRQTRVARLPHRINSDRGRTEFLLVGLVRSGSEFVAYPLGKGSGSVTTFSLADGFVTIDQHTEILEPGHQVSVQLLGATVEPADLVFIGSHCVGLDLLIDELLHMGFTAKAIHVGSTGGLAAAARGECDVAGVHLLDPETNTYNHSFLTEGMTLVEGYLRRQGLVFQPGDERFMMPNFEQALDHALASDTCAMINRNAGSGTRILIDQLLHGRRPPGYSVQARSHNAVAAAVKQRRADWGVAIESVAREYDLGFLAIGPEQYDFVIPANRRERPAVMAFVRLLNDLQIRKQLNACGLESVEHSATSEKS